MLDWVSKNHIKIQFHLDICVEEELNSVHVQLLFELQRNKSLTDFHCHLVDGKLQLVRARIIVVLLWKAYVLN